MSDTYSVWTHNTSPEWLAKNSGISDMVLTSGLGRYEANFLVLRLQLLMPFALLWIWDEQNNAVPLVAEEDAYRELVENPRRESIGLAPRTKLQPWEVKP